MTDDQKTALEGLVGRTLTTAESELLDTHLPIRNDVAIAAILSNGRTKLIPHMISERGVRAALPIQAGSQFIRVLKEASEATGVPAWLGTVLTAMGIPSEYHIDYADAIASAYGWMRSDGLDLSSEATRAMIDIIAASDPAKFASVATTLKALAVQANPIGVGTVSDALNIAEGRMTL